MILRCSPKVGRGLRKVTASFLQYSQGLPILPLFIWRWRERPFLDLLPPPHMILMSPYRREIFHVPPLFPGSLPILPSHLPSFYLGDPIFVERCHNIVVQLAVLRPQVLCILTPFRRCSGRDCRP